MSTTIPSIAQLKHAILLNERLAVLEKELAALLGSKQVSAPKAPAAVPIKRKGGMSAEGRARIIAAQKARWAKVKAAKAPAAPVKAAPAPKKGKKRGKLSPEGLARIIAAQKLRWAKAKKGK